MNFGTVGKPYWNDKTVVIVGGGPSLNGFDMERLRGRFHVLAVKATIFDIPWCDAGFGLECADLARWWDRLTKLSTPNYWAIPDNWFFRRPLRPSPGMTFLRRRAGTELSRNTGAITSGGSSGFGALNLAVLKGARKIVLLGYDYRPTGHHNDRHYPGRIETPAAKWTEWAGNFDRAAMALKADGVEVLNASPESMITAFPKCTHESIFR